MRASRSIHLHSLLVLCIASAVTLANGQLGRTSNRRKTEAEAFTTEFSNSEDSSNFEEFWPHHEHDPCDVTGETCKGISYWKVIQKEDIGLGSESEVPFSTWLEKTPDNCVLAPIGSEDEFKELQSATAFISGRIFVGIRKSAANVANDNSGNGSTQNWFNLDGTPAAVTSTSLWASGQPDNYNNLGLTLAFIQNGELWDTLNNGPDLVGAVYKCCGGKVLGFPTCS